jgi:hypothetical protein
VLAALEVIRADNAWTLGQQVSLCEIPAPPFGEARRAAEYRRRLTALGLRNVRIDAEGNAIGEHPGTGDGPTVVTSTPSFPKAPTSGRGPSPAASTVLESETTAGGSPSCSRWRVRFSELAYARTAP